MKRTPCCLAISPSSCGSMMTKRDLSYSKCRSISGSVPLPIEPKPIMTMGPEIFAWTGATGLLAGAPENCVCAGSAKAAGHCVAGIKATQCRVWPVKSSGVSGQFSGFSDLNRPAPGCRAGRRDNAPEVVERALAQLEAKQAVAFERAGQRQFAGFPGGEAEPRVIGRIPEQDHRAMAARLRRR